MTQRPARLNAAAGSESGSFPTMSEMNPFELGSREAQLVDALMQTLQVDNEEQRQRIEQTPQGTQDWLDARKYRLTASNFGAAAGRNRFRSPKQLVQDMLYGEFKGNDATRWGSEKESVALSDYVKRKRDELAADGRRREAFFVTQSGLHVCADAGWLAASPDGHVNDGSEKGLLEIKCPYSKRIYPSIPNYYVDQVQGLCAILGYDWADFVVWTPEQMQVQRLGFDVDYWQEDLLPALVSFYRDLFLPAYVEMRLGELDGGDTQGRIGDAAGKGGKPAATRAGKSKEPEARAPSHAAAGQPSRSGGEGRRQGAGQDLRGASAAPALVSTIFLNAAPPPPPRRMLLRQPVGREERRQQGAGGRGGRGGLRSGDRSGPFLDEDTHTRLVEVVQEVDAELSKRMCKLEFVGTGPDSFFLALALQLHRQGVLQLTRESGSSLGGPGGAEQPVAPVAGEQPPAGGQLVDPSAAMAGASDLASGNRKCIGAEDECIREGARQLRLKVLGHMAAHRHYYLDLTGLDLPGLRARMDAISSQQLPVGGPELAAAAAMLNASISCFLVSAKGLDERRFEPPTSGELMRGQHSMPVDANDEDGQHHDTGQGVTSSAPGQGSVELCLVTAGRFFWSTKGFTEPTHTWSQGRSQSAAELPETRVQNGSKSDRLRGDHEKHAVEGKLDGTTRERGGEGGMSKGDTCHLVDHTAAQGLVSRGGTQASPTERGEPCAANLECLAADAKPWGINGSAVSGQSSGEELGSPKGAAPSESSDEGIGIVESTVDLSRNDGTEGRRGDVGVHTAGDIAAEEDSLAKVGGLATWEGSAGARDGGGGGDKVQARARKFSSRYSPLFQRCIVDVEGKLAAGGKDALKSLEGAFRICNKSVGERKFGAHTVRRDGTTVTDLDKLARQYEALLIRHRAIILGALKDPSKPP